MSVFPAKSGTGRGIYKVVADATLGITRKGQIGHIPTANALGRSEQTRQTKETAAEGVTDGFWLNRDA